MIDRIVALIQGAEIENDGEITLGRTLSYLLRSEFEGVVVCQEQLYLYNAGVWQMVGRSEMISAIQAFNGLEWIQGDKPKKIVMRFSKGVGIYQSLLSCREILDNKFFDDVPAGVAFQNGFLSVQGGKLEAVPHSPSHKAIMLIDEKIPKNPNELAPTAFITFLSELFEGDSDAVQKIVLIRQFIGMCLAGLAAVEGQKALMLLGSGSNGKSVLIDIITSLFAQRSVVSSSPSKWDNEYYVSLLQHARLNVCSELPETTRGSGSDIMKQVITADFVTGREVYGKPVSFRATCGHIFAANSLPASVSGDYSHGFFRRWIILELKRQFGEDTPRRSSKEIIASMQKERGAIIIWALRSVAQVLQDGEYTLPESSMKVFSRWKQETNPIADFIARCTEPNDSFEKFSYVFKNYLDFAEGVGRSTKMHQNTFSSKLRDLGVEFKRSAKGQNVALRIKPKPDWIDFQ